MNKCHLINGECLDKMQSIPDKSIDMILCDLPYGTTSCKWDSIIPVEELWCQYKRIIKNNGVIALFGIESFTTRLISSNFKMFRYNWYWDKGKKTGFTFAKYQPMRRIETISIFYKKMPCYNPQGLIKLDTPKYEPNKKVNIYNQKSLDKPHYCYYRNYPSHLLEFKKEYLLHPTQKPVPLLEYLIKTYTIEGETIMDNCFGSCSTGAACINTNRNFIGIEQDSKYFNIGVKRIQDLESNYNIIIE